jgi:tight adherence protein C
VRLLVLMGPMTPPIVLLPVPAAAAYDLQLSASVSSRRARLTDELPTMLEFLSLCLSAGEGLLDSLRRVTTVDSGELVGELRQVVLAVGIGSPLADALGEMAARLQLPGVTRAVDQVVAALERGAPLAGVLHAQAGDAREDAKRTLIEQAGRKESLMLLPCKRV